MKEYLAVLIPLIGIDFLWIGIIAKGFYQKHLGYIFAEKITYWPVVLFYAIYAFGILYFVVNPALEAKSLFMAFYRGAFLGLLAYMAYDLTNQATIARWPLAVTLADLAWGVFVTAIVSVIAYTILSKI